MGRKAAVEQEPIVRRDLKFGQAVRSLLNQAFAASLSYLSRMTIVKTSGFYFACVSPVTTAATFSSIWFQPSI